jgi:hypothetical protein
MMDITSLQIECDLVGTKVTAWCKCRSPDDIEDLIEWLNAAERVMTDWRGILDRRSVAAPPAAKANVTPIKGKPPP